MRIMMVIASGVSYLLNAAWAKASFGDAKTMNFETPLTRLVWLTSIVSVVRDLRGLAVPDPRPRRQPGPVVAALDGHHLRHAGGRDHPGAGEDLHVDRVEPRRARS